jgi:Uma2 family endonuclease
MVRLDVNPPLMSKAVEDVADEIKLPPTNLYSDEPPLETDFHREQIELLIRLLKHWWRDRPNFYISGNLTVYYDEQQIKKRKFRGPDIFVVLDAEKKNRRSWAIWEEGGKYPNVVIELLSSATARTDRGEKKLLYQNVWRVPDYFWFHPETMEFQGFHLVNGQYQEIVPTEAGWLWSKQLGLYLGIHERQLRWFSAEGSLVLLPEEQERLAKEQAQQQADRERLAKEQAQQQADRERLAKEQAQQQADRERLAKERLENYLRSQGIDPTQLADP